jgi:hypothetical protein
MFQWKIRLDTLTDAKDFLFIASKIPEEVYIRSGEHLCTSAKSALGCHMASVEWNNLVCVCEKDIFMKIRRFIVENTPETLENW